MYCLRKIPFEGQDRTIILQSKPGPCPILAIYNCLSLRGQVSFHPSLQVVRFQQIVELLREYLQNRLQSLISASDTKEEVLANALASFESVNTTLPNFEEGLDVNVIFQDHSRFEFTAEISVFDSFNVRLMHAWVVDPQDSETSRVLGSKTYNELTEFILNDGIESAPQPKHVSSQAVSSSSQVGSDSNVAPVVVQSSESVNTNESAPAIATSSTEAQHAEAETAPSSDHTPTGRFVFVPRPAEPVPAPSPDSAELVPEPSCFTESPPVSADPVNLEVVATASHTTDTDLAIAKSAQDRALASKFLQDSPNQMTVYGLMLLHENLREGAVAALFHNNHFSCAWKCNGEIYELITDVRIVDEQPLLVWTKLAQTDNDSMFLDAFLRRPLSNATAAAQEFNLQRRSALVDRHRANPAGSDNFYWAHVYSPAYTRAEHERIAAQQSKNTNFRSGPLAALQPVGPIDSQAKSATNNASQDARIQSMYQEQQRVMAMRHFEQQEYEREAARRREAEKEDDGCLIS